MPERAVEIDAVTLVRGPTSCRLILVFVQIATAEPSFCVLRQALLERLRSLEDLGDGVCSLHGSVRAVEHCANAAADDRHFAEVGEDLHSWGTAAAFIRIEGDTELPEVIGDFL